MARFNNIVEINRTSDTSLETFEDGVNREILPVLGLVKILAVFSLSNVLAMVLAISWYPLCLDIFSL